MADDKREKNLVYQVESDILRYSRITKLSFRKDPEYFAGRAGLVRILNLILSSLSVCLMLPGYNEEEFSQDEYPQVVQGMGNTTFMGYGESGFTLAAMVLGGSTVFISATFLILLFLFMEVRCDLLWERINQKAHVLACLLSVIAGFCNILSLQEVQIANCRSSGCEEEEHQTRTIKYEEPFYPPYFVYHYSAFVGFLSNAMLYSIASRIWLRNSD